MLKEAGVFVMKAHTHHGLHGENQEVEEQIELSEDDHHNVSNEQCEPNIIAPEAKDQQDPDSS